MPARAGGGWVVSHEPRFNPHAGRAVRPRGVGALVGVGASLACALVVGAPWLSGSASAEPTPDPSPSPLVVQLSPEPSPFPHYGEPEDLLTPHCEISQGVYPRPVPSGSASWLPSWVSPSDGFVCVQLDASALLDSPGQTWLGPDQEPSLSPDVQALQAAMDAWRELYLYSAGLVIFLLGAIFFRVRSR